MGAVLERVFSHSQLMGWLPLSSKVTGLLFCGYKGINVTRLITYGGLGSLPQRRMARSRGGSKSRLLTAVTVVFEVTVP